MNAAMIIDWKKRLAAGGSALLLACSLTACDLGKKAPRFQRVHANHGGSRHDGLHGFHSRPHHGHDRPDAGRNPAFRRLGDSGLDACAQRAGPGL